MAFINSHISDADLGRLLVGLHKPPGLPRNGAWCGRFRTPGTRPNPVLVRKFWHGSTWGRWGRPRVVVLVLISETFFLLLGTSRVCLFLAPRNVRGRLGQPLHEIFAQHFYKVEKQRPLLLRKEACSRPWSCCKTLWSSFCSGWSWGRWIFVGLHSWEASQISHYDEGYEL